MRRARVRLAQSDMPFVAECQINGGMLHCQVEVARRPLEFVETGHNEVRVVKEPVNRTWPMEQVASVDWLEAAQAA